MARTKQFDEGQVLDAAMHKFWESGFEATSMQDLEECTDLNRTSLYNAFGNKRQLFERVLGCYTENVLGSLFAELESAPTVKQGVRAFLNAALNLHYDKNKPGGCLMALSVLESAQHDKKTTETMQQTMRELKRVLQTRLSNAKKSGELSQTLDAGGVATAITTTVAGMAIMSKAGFPKSAVKKVGDQIVKLLD